MKGVIFMSPAAFDIAPLKPPPDRRVQSHVHPRRCGQNVWVKGGAFSAEGALPGRAAGQPGGPPASWRPWRIRSSC